jgi:hypothetical protein
MKLTGKVDWISLRTDVTPLCVDGVTYELPAVGPCQTTTWLSIARMKGVPIRLTLYAAGAVTGFEMVIEGYHIAFPSLTERPVISKL